MQLTVKDMDIATGGIFVAIVHQEDAAQLDLHHEDRVKVRLKNRSVTAVLDISESKRAVPRGSIGLFEEVLDALHARGGDHVSIALAAKPESVSSIRDKLHGKRLSRGELYGIVDDIVHDRLTAVEKTYFVSATYAVGLHMDEIVHLTR